MGIDVYLRWELMTDEELARRLQDEEDARADEEDARRAARTREAQRSGAQMLVGKKLTYSCGDDKWNEEPVRLRVEDEPKRQAALVGG